MPLTVKQEAFCLAYLETGNASEAYRRAYSAQNMKPESVAVAASRALSNAKVALRVSELRERSQTAAVMSRQEALERLTRIGRTSLSDLIDWRTVELGRDDDGNLIQQTSWALKDSVAQDPGSLSLISELSATKDGIKIKTHSQLQAIQQLAKMQGWDIQGLETDLELKRLAAEKLRRELEDPNKGLPEPKQVIIGVEDASLPDAE